MKVRYYIMKMQLKDYKRPEHWEIILSAVWTSSFTTLTQIFCFY